jgi:hypothetical protein
MKKKYVLSRIALSLAIGGLVFASPHGSVAQEDAQEPAEHEGSMSMHGMMGMQGMTGDMHKKHEQMMTKRKAMLAALQEHTQTLEGVTDQQRVLTELKKHQHDRCVSGHTS